jgi:hypothetical protein
MKNSNILPPQNFIDLYSLELREKHVFHCYLGVGVVKFNNYVAKNKTKKQVIIGKHINLLIHSSLPTLQGSS